MMRSSARMAPSGLRRPLLVGLMRLELDLAAQVGSHFFEGFDEVVADPPAFARDPAGPGVRARRGGPTRIALPETRRRAPAGTPSFAVAIAQPRNLMLSRAARMRRRCSVDTFRRGRSPSLNIGSRRCRRLALGGEHLTRPAFASLRRATLPFQGRDK